MRCGDAKTAFKCTTRTKSGTTESRQFCRVLCMDPTDPTRVLRRTLVADRVEGSLASIAGDRSAKTGDYAYAFLQYLDIESAEHRRHLAETRERQPYDNIAFSSFRKNWSPHFRKLLWSRRRNRAPNSALENRRPVLPTSATISLSFNSKAIRNFFRTSLLVKGVSEQRRTWAPRSCLRWQATPRTRSSGCTTASSARSSITTGGSQSTVLFGASS
jgi:hypothetical protein